MPQQVPGKTPNLERARNVFLFALSPNVPAFLGGSSLSSFFPFFLYLPLSPMMLMRVTDLGTKKEGALWVLTAVQRSRVQASARRTKCHMVI